MGKSDDPEQLLAEALRAQAAQTPVTPDPTTSAPERVEPASRRIDEEDHPDSDTGSSTGSASTGSDAPGDGTAVDAAPGLNRPPDESGVGYGLLSGADASTVAQVRAELEDPDPPSAATRGTVRASTESLSGRQAPRAQLGAGWILLLAILLGLAVGSVLGLATVL